MILKSQIRLVEPKVASTKLIFAIKHNVVEEGKKRNVTILNEVQLLFYLWVLTPAPLTDDLFR